MVMFDSLNRHMLPPYGCDWTVAPNFSRLAKRTAVFERSYVASMPCMPARRELHTGRYNFLHRGWGPLEPFDDSMPQMLAESAVYTHLVSDHYHYWEDGGCTYHNRYNTWDFFRGQEGDPWIGQVADPHMPPTVPGRGGKMYRQDCINRQVMPTEDAQPQSRTFTAGIEFIRRNAGADKWFLQLETFDPHEPFFTQAKYKDLYPHRYFGPHFDWPPYRAVQETPEEIHHVRMEYAALLSMCDAQLGRVLDVMDELDLWKDTMLIVNTDHGFLLNEHDCWAKCWAPFYQEVAHTPLFVHDPRCPQADGQRRTSLVQTIDLAPTLLEFFGIDRPADMQGVPLRRTIENDTPIREAGLFGQFGGYVNCTDGRYVYMRAPVTQDNTPLNHYTLMPTHMRQPFSPQELRGAQLARPFSFTKDAPVLKVPGTAWNANFSRGSMLFDIQEDPGQQRPISDPKIEKMMIDMMVGLMKSNDCPPEQYERLGLKEIANCEARIAK